MKGNGATKIKAVFLDAGGTLFRPFPSVGHVYSRVAKKYGTQVTPGWVERRFRTLWWERNGLDHSRPKSQGADKRWWRDLVKTLFDSKMSKQRFEGYFEELYDLFARPETWKLFPETLKTLAFLKKAGFTLGVVSNWDARLFKLCDSLGVSNYVDFVLASAVVGSAKPEKGIFWAALQRAGVEPGEALHVGDTDLDDYQGAQRAGLQAVLLCRQGPKPMGRRTIRNLSEIKLVLEGKHPERTKVAS